MKASSVITCAASALVCVLVPSRAMSEASPTRPIPVAVVVPHGAFENADTDELEKLATKLRARLEKGKVKLASLATDSSKATVVVRLLSREEVATGGQRANEDGLPGTFAEQKLVVNGELLVGDKGVPFSSYVIRLHRFGKVSVEGMDGPVGESIEDFIKRNYAKLSAPAK